VSVFQWFWYLVLYNTIIYSPAGLYF